MTNEHFIIRGITDTVSVCDCCGKTNLKRAVILENNNTGEIVHFGTNCAGRAVFGRKSVANERAVIGQSLVLSKCEAIKDLVLHLVASGETETTICRHIPAEFTVLFGQYADTGNKKPLRIFWSGYQTPGVTLKPSDY